MIKQLLCIIMAPSTRTILKFKENTIEMEYYSKYLFKFFVTPLKPFNKQCTLMVYYNLDLAPNT